MHYFKVYTSTGYKYPLSAENNTVSVNEASELLKKVMNNFNETYGRVVDVKPTTHMWFMAANKSLGRVEA